ncbi:hypothetical protein N9F44_01195 [Akkermansiaceae bacterium]|nr:hypothetical protein [Akkermansiaceae bacterium]MDA7536865.1 hypothetical protein [bacterium]MDA7517820.1 hypothetical protein [Akkermansiaceae bacterium]MDA7863899.1 hypothetical protein [Akkermansiaceae bacterium]MDA8975601.1 hypothetical protein [Akkermansiaceae bacterium]
MIDHLLFYKLKPEVDEGKLEDMIRMSRSLLLKIPRGPHGAVWQDDRS